VLESSESASIEPFAFCMLHNLKLTC
jgi:hypothetical protein